MKNKNNIFVDVADVKFGQKETVVVNFLTLLTHSYKNDKEHDIILLT